MWIISLWVLEAAIVLIDFFTLPDLSFIGYFLVPSLIAVTFAPPRTVLWLAIASVVFGIVSGWHSDTLLTTPYLVRLGALAVIGASAYLLAIRREQQQAALNAQTSLLQGTLDSLLEPHVLLRAVRDERGDITDFVFADANGSACAYNNLPRARLVGRRLLELLPAHAATGLFDLYRRVIESGRSLALDDYRYPHDIHEEPRYFDIRAVKVGDALSYTWRDVTERHRQAENLEHRIRTDELTKLLNRREVFERFEDLCGKAPRTGSDLAVLFIDFDKFKAINDTHGHTAGDEVLRVTAERLRTCLRHDDDLGARIGGDEMMVVLHGVHGVNDAARVAEKLRTRAAEPISINGTRLSITVSIGVALARPGEKTAALVARADEAMYRAKKRGRNQVITIQS